MTAELIVSVRGGARIAVAPRLNQTSTYVLLEQEDWFEDEIRFVRRWLRPGMQAIDVGANVGVYTAALAKAAGRDGHVWAFEPTPDTAGLLRRTVELNDLRATITQAAVSHSSGRRDFHLGNTPEENALAGPDAAPAQTISVAAVTLDEMAREHRWTAIDFVKLDVEGHEPDVIRGGDAFFRANSPLVMFEFGGTSRMDFTALDLLEEMGYSAYRLLPGPMLLERLDRSAMDSYQINLLACKKDRACQIAAAGFLVSGETTARPGFSSRDDTNAYLQGLALFARYRDGARDAVERLSLLSHATQLVAGSLAGEPSLGKIISYARLAYEVGRREAAKDALWQALQRLGTESVGALAEPFLMPSECYGRLPMDDQPSARLRCALTEQFERLRGFSSIFMEASSLAILEPILGLPFCSAEMHRRWQLVRITGGLQDGPQAEPLLCRRSEENLNPQFWCADSA